MHISSFNTTALSAWLLSTLHIHSFNKALSAYLFSQMFVQLYWSRNGSGDATDGLVMRSIESLFEKIRTLQREGLQFKVCSRGIGGSGHGYNSLLKPAGGSA